MEKTFILDLIILQKNYIIYNICKSVSILY